MKTTPWELVTAEAAKPPRAQSYWSLMHSLNELATTIRISNFIARVISQRWLGDRNEMTLEISGLSGEPRLGRFRGIVFLDKTIRVDGKTDDFHLYIRSCRSELHDGKPYVIMESCRVLHPGEPISYEEQIQ